MTDDVSPKLVHLRGSTHAKVKAIAALTKRTIQQCVDEALINWTNINGHVLLEQGFDASKGRQDETNSDLSHVSQLDNTPIAKTDKTHP